MLILLSPAKTQNFSDLAPKCTHSLPQAQQDLSTLITLLKSYTAAQLQQLMHLSPKLAILNHQRFQNFDPLNFNLQNAKPAIYVFEGDAYRALAIHSLSAAQLTYLQKHLVILSGLYGYLRPLDLIQPYRLEMGTKLATVSGNNLYQFWGNKITQALNQQVKAHQYTAIINLASDEYFSAIKTTQLDVPVVTIQFKEKTPSGYRTIGINAKRARGAMTRLIAENSISRAEELKTIQVNNYSFNKALSTESCLCFTR